MKYTFHEGMGLPVGTYRWTFHCFMAKVTITKNEIYNLENLIGPFSVTFAPPPLPLFCGLSTRHIHHLHTGAP